jgi:hypothetical protein
MARVARFHEFIDRWVRWSDFEGTTQPPAWVPRPQLNCVIAVVGFQD